MFKVEMELNPNEQIIHQGGANHFVGMEGVGGKLFMTNQRLFYKSHGMNIQDHELTIEFDDIVRLELCRTMYVIPNGLKIHLKNRDVEQFVVQGRKKWMTLLLEKID